MADFVFNICKGRGVELHNRVKAGDPSTARLYLIPVDVAAVSDATLKDLDDFAAIITAGVTERAATGWNRKTIAAADLTTGVPNDSNDSFDVDMIDQTWTTVTAGTVTDLILCYASVSSPTNSQLVPMAQYDYPITPTGVNEVAQINAAGYYRAA